MAKSQYGYRIKNIQAASIWEVNHGVRKNLDADDAMLTNSLFLDFLEQNGLEVHKEESTRDVVCICFDYGSRSYNEEVKHLAEHIKKTEADEKLDDEKKAQKIDYFKQLQQDMVGKEDCFIKKSRQELRTEYYVNGVDITYHTYNKKGEITKSETIHYQMLYRSPGKAKAGKCMFIRDRLFKKAQKFLRMGLKLPKKNAPIVEIGAYQSLVTSTIVDRIKINPENVLILKDVQSHFNTKVISIETNEAKECQAIERDDYQITSTLFDGQGLIDSSIFPDWADGYILLRQHFFKAACFCTNIQQFFKDYYGDRYETAQIEDMFGKLHYAKDIELITTDNATKWLKFDVSYDYWCDRVRENGSLFGIVKTAHPSKLGTVQKASYQMINSLDLDLMDSITQCTKDYIYKLKNDDAAFLDYLKRNSTFSNDYEALIALVEQDKDFINCEYFRERRWQIISAYLTNVKSGKVINNADNLTLVGNPYAMLMYTVGLNSEEDPTLNVEDGCIQCYSERFDDGEYLAGFRSPYNSRNGLSYLHNHRTELMRKYFVLGKYCMAVNCIKSDFEDRNNGSDFDSDSQYVTNQPQIVDCARRFVTEYPTIVNNIPKEKNHYPSSPEAFAAVDNKLGSAQMAIGESSNLAQLCLTYSFNFTDDKYLKNVCILACLAQCAIDNAKRSFDIDLTNEIRRIKKDMNLSENGYPVFWSIIRPGFNKAKINKKLKCPMNYLFYLKTNMTENSNVKTYPITDFFEDYDVYDINKTWRKNKRVENLIIKYSIQLNRLNSTDVSDDTEDVWLLEDKFNELIDDIRAITISKKYKNLMLYLINRSFAINAGAKSKKDINQTALRKNRTLLLKVLYEVNSKVFLSCFAKNVKN